MWQYSDSGYDYSDTDTDLRRQYYIGVDSMCWDCPCKTVGKNFLKDVLAERNVLVGKNVLCCYNV